MNTVPQRREAASFRFQPLLLKRLRENAAKENRSLNNYVESILLEAVFRPNDDTLEAMKEAKEGKYAGVLDLSSDAAFYNSIKDA
ncbi:MAG: type II toxin-antitoxin system HicB family antitoxin [Bacteroidales bacterium]|nr:type II toxin-antitoxin system HicB family antitoxin [Bacteroidales bacterium]